MIYKLLVLIYVFFSVIGSIFYKTIKVDAIHISIICILGLVIPIIIYIYIDYKNNPLKYKVEKNKLGYGDNPFKNILNKYTFILAILATLTYIPFLYCLNILPINFIIPFGLLWLVFSLIFNKLIRNVAITKDKLISIGIVLFGILIMQFQIFVKDFSFKPNYIFPIAILLFTQVIKGIFITYTKEVSEIISPNQLIMIESTLSFFIYLLVYIIYITNPLKKWYVSYPNTKDVIKLSLFAVIVSTLSNHLKFLGLKMLRVNTYNLLISTKIIFSTILARIILKESITLYHIIGCIIILIGLNLTTIDSLLHYPIPIPHPLN